MRVRFSLGDLEKHKTKKWGVFNSFHSNKEVVTTYRNMCAKGNRRSNVNKLFVSDYVNRQTSRTQNYSKLNFNIDFPA